MSARRAAFFDMDKTLVRVNTGRLYMKWRMARGEAGWRDMARFSRWMFRYSLGLLDPSDITRRAVGTLTGIEEATFRRELSDWYQTHVRQHISEAARREVDRCRARGDQLVVLTASTRYAADPLALELDIEHVLATTLEVSGGKFTGECATLCYGAGKVDVARQWAAQHDVDLRQSAFYTDSVSDAPMLEVVGEPRVVNPDLRLGRLARQRGWPIDHWR